MPEWDEVKTKVFSDKRIRDLEWRQAEMERIVYRTLEALQAAHTNQDIMPEAHNHRILSETAKGWLDNLKEQINLLRREKIEHL